MAQVQQQTTLGTTKRISRLNFMSRWEVAELPRLLMPDEHVLGVISGFYSAGTAILCITSKRILLVDKKLMRLNYEDIRFEAIKEVSYSHQALMASVRFFYAGRTLQFRSWYRHELRALAQFAQHKMFEVREDATAYHETNLAQTAETPVQQQPTAYQASPQLDQYLSERIARWRRASKFIDSIPSASNSSVLE